MGYLGKEKKHSFACFKDSITVIHPQGCPIYGVAHTLLRKKLLFCLLPMLQIPVLTRRSILNHTGHGEYTAFKQSVVALWGAFIALIRAFKEQSTASVIRMTLHGRSEMLRNGLGILFLNLSILPSMNHQDMLKRFVKRSSGLDPGFGFVPWGSIHATQISDCFN